MDLPSILVINLPERKDRWIRVENEFQTWRTVVERVDAIRATPGWKGCSLSHRKCIEIAKNRGWEWVLIIEDDCQLTDDAKNRFRELLPVLWARRNEWDVFNGGPSQIKDLRNLNVVSSEPPLFDIKSYVTQFCLIHQDYYDTFLDKVGEHVRIDLFHLESSRVWCTYPHLSIQAPGKSDIENRSMDYTNNFKDSNEHLYNALIMDKWKWIPVGVGSTLIVGASLALLYLKIKK